MERRVIVVYERIGGRGYNHGSTAFLVMVAIVVPMPTVFAAVFEQPFLRLSRRAGFHRASVA